MFVLWSRYMHKQLADGSGEWTGPRLPVLTRRLFVEFASFPGQALVLLAGAALAAARARALSVSRWPPPWGLAIGWFVMNYAFLAAFLVLNWDRYYATTVVLECLLAAGALGALAGAIRARVAPPRAAARA